MAREIGIAHLTLLDVAPPELVSLSAAAGFAAVGIRVATAGPGEEPWPMTGDSPMLEETVRRLADAGIRCLDVEVLQLGPDTGDYEPILEAGARLGARFLNVMGDDPEPERMAERFAALAADARPYGLRPLIEPIPYRAVGNLRQAVRVAEGSGGAVEIDCLHFQRYGGDFAELRAVDPDLLPVLQLCDAPLAAPSGLSRPSHLPRGQATDVDDRVLESRAMRLLPGDGELPVSEMIAAMPPGIPLSVEAPAISLRESLGAEEFARRARVAVDAVLPAGGDAGAVGEPGRG
jgi:sugar phosphate isomerase/epimerase